jgi:hypothetical protein
MLGILEKGLSIVRAVLYRLLAWLGRHPLVLTVLPSLWLFARYRPFWKDVDAVVQLLDAVNSSNVLHCPPVYCFLGRVPFWLTGMLIHGSAADIFSDQAPSLLSAQALVFFQHAGLWVSSRYFLFSVPWSDVRRGMATVLLASVASFYTFAHTGGSEAMTPVCWIAVFASGLRILLRPSLKANWIVHAVALWLAVGSRTVNTVLLLWLPFTITGLICYRLLTKGDRALLNVRLRQGLFAAIVSLGVFGAEKSLVFVLCQRFSIIERSTDGWTFSDRIGTLVATLSPEEKAKFHAASLALAWTPNIRVAIDAQFDFISFHLGGYKEIRQALYEQGWRGQELDAELDRVILEAALCLYRAAPHQLVAQILKEFIRSWTTSDYRIARAGPFATFEFAQDLLDQNNENLPRAAFVRLASPLLMLNCVDADPIINHWENLPLVAWFWLFLSVGIGRTMRGTLSLRLVFLVVNFVLIGTAADLAACIFAYGQPRYTLPLLTTVFVAGCVLLFGLDENKTT